MELLPSVKDIKRAEAETEEINKRCDWKIQMGRKANVVMLLVMLVVGIIIIIVA